MLQNSKQTSTRLLRFVSSAAVILVNDLIWCHQGSVTEHVYLCLLKLYDKYEDNGLRGRILQCLGMSRTSSRAFHKLTCTEGFLFRAQPALMTAEPSAKIMDAIFSSPVEEARGRLLKILQDFLMSEAAKHAANEKGLVDSLIQYVNITDMYSQP